jgi:hypothetical protein
MNKFEELNDRFTSLGTGMTQQHKFRDRWCTLLLKYSLRPIKNAIEQFKIFQKKNAKVTYYQNTPGLGVGPTRTGNSQTPAPHA